jgi:polysaccharide chain length determinant protein (PEP-CTERM system associated)
MNQQKSENTLTPEVIINTVLRVSLKYRWLIIIPLFLAILTGSYFSIKLPKKYEASTTIMVQEQRVPSSYVQSVVTTDITSRLRSITQQVKSRTNVERIIEEFQLLSGPEYNDMFLEDKIENVRSRIDVNTIRSTMFTISFQGGSPEKVKNITNVLADYFIDENLKIREAQATGTSDFLDDELQSMREKLEKSEQEYREYRQRYYGELPEQLEGNLSNRDNLNEQLFEKQIMLRENKNLVADLENKIAEAKANNRMLLTAEQAAQNTAGDIAQLQSQLEVLRTRYTDNHPSVVRLKKMIQKRIESENTVSDELETAAALSINLSPQERQVDELKSEIQAMELEIVELKKKVDLHQQRIDNTPKREEELFTIKRDYENLQDIYNSLSSRRLEAQLSVNMEKKQKGEQFQIIDTARLPEKPISPNMKAIFLASIVMGLGIGGGIAFFLEYTNNSFKSIEEVESTIGLPVLATVPAILEAKDKTLKRLNNVFSIASFAICLLLMFGFAAISFKGVDGTIEIIKTLTN